jgi:hypothetical protein
MRLALLALVWLALPSPRAPPPLGAQPPVIPRPLGFAPDYLARIHRDFADFAGRRLGRGLSGDEAAGAAAAQDAFWAEHAPNVLLLQRGALRPEEFASRTRAATRHFAARLERVFSDGDHLTIFDVPKGTDWFPLLYHSPAEQPGRPRLFL